MNKFKVIQPSVLLVPYVKQYWFLRMEDVVRSSQRLVPLGCVVLSFHRGNFTYSSQEKDYLPRSHFYGITADYTDLVFSGCVDFISIVFQPAGTSRFFKIPPVEWKDRPVPLDALEDPELLYLEQCLNETTDDLSCVDLIEKFLFRRMYRLDKEDDKRIHAVIDSIRQGNADIDSLAQTACLCHKQFRRVFCEKIGANPKDFLQIMRFQKLHHLMQLHTGMTLTELAYECGYYDKSHLVKELKDFSGFTPAQLSNACEPVYSGYHGLFRSAFIDLPSE